MTPTRECRYPHYEIEDARLKTFKHWPLYLLPKPAVLAEAGFYYTGVGDRTQCFFCGGGLKDWEPEADPWVQHARWYECQFVEGVKGKDYVRDVVEQWWGSETACVSKRSTGSRQNGCCPCHIQIGDHHPVQADFDHGNCIRHITG